MGKEEKLLKMFEAIHGKLADNLEFVVTGYHEEEAIVTLYKDGDRCWSLMQSELLFEYVTLGW